MEQTLRRSPDTWTMPIGRREFIALTAALMALNAIAIDIMLPAMQQIGANLGVADENERQFVISSYIVGFGVAQLFFGPISDRFGRRAPLLIGLAIYVIAATSAAFSGTFTALLALRFAQGIGAASTRVIAISIVRDVFGGRRMAEVMSLVMMVFMIIPVIAPSAGQLIMLFGEWHMIFVLMGLAALSIATWAAFRLPETLPPERRRGFTFKIIAEGFRIVLTTRAAVLYTFATMFMFSAVFGFINSAQQVFIEIYHLGAWFPLVFAVIAGMMSLSSFLNSRLVGRFGMRRLSQFALLGYIAMAATMFLLSLEMTLPLPVFLGLFACAMFLFGWTMPNFNALAMEPLGHVAGTASSVQGFLQTLGGGIIGASIGQAFNGTITPLAGSFLLVASASLLMVLLAERGRLFQAQNEPC